MGTKIIDEIRKNMAGKSTDELLQIWKENNLEVWSEDALEAAKQILIERNVELPVQNIKAVNLSNNNGEIKRHILAVVIGIIGLAMTSLLSKNGLLATRGHEIVLIVGFACAALTIYRGFSIVMGVSISVIGTAIIFALFQMKYLSPGNAPFAAIALIAIVSFAIEVLRKN